MSDNYQTLHERVTILERRASIIESAQKDHLAKTDAIKSDTGELLQIITALKGAWAVLEFIGKAAKPIAWVGGLVAASAVFLSQRK
jgi:hypothetical protein